MHTGKRKADHTIDISSKRLRNLADDTFTATELQYRLEFPTVAEREKNLAIYNGTWAANQK